MNKEQKINKLRQAIGLMHEVYETDPEKYELLMFPPDEIECVIDIIKEETVE